jgi:hypothetical protein
MMNDRGKSDSAVVPAKRPNNAEEPAAEGGEGRALAKGNSPEHTALRTQGRAGASHALERVRQAARKDKKQRFTALLHHVYAIARLRAAYLALQRDAAAGVDGETWRHYGEHLEANLQDLSGRLQRGAYRAQPVRRAYIPKADGRSRPLGIPTLEDQIVQRAVAEVLTAIYDTDFLGFTHSCAKTRTGRFTVLRQTMRRRWQAKLQAVKLELRRRLHQSIPEQGTYLRQVVRGHLQYYGGPLHGPALHAFHAAVGRLWCRVLRRRSQRHRLPWPRMQRFLRRWFPPVRLCHPYPLVRVGVVTQGRSRMR